MNSNLSKTPVIDISIQDPIWDKLGDIETIVCDAATKALESAIMPKFAYGKALEMSLVLANDGLVQVLNREYRGKDSPTNVLSFASLDGEDFEAEMLVEPLNIGDVILSYQTIERECQEQGKFFLEHVKHLTVHGVLHLLGYDHQDDNEATDMETLEIRILEQLGVQNPYTDTGV
jgi:probable rRNA maturation factor